MLLLINEIFYFFFQVMPTPGAMVLVVAWDMVILYPENIPRKLMPSKVL